MWYCSSLLHACHLTINAACKKEAVSCHSRKKIKVGLISAGWIIRLRFNVITRRNPFKWILSDSFVGIVQISCRLKPPRPFIFQDLILHRSIGLWEKPEQSNVLVNTSQDYDDSPHGIWVKSVTCIFNIQILGREVSPRRSHAEWKWATTAVTYELLGRQKQESQSSVGSF